MTLAELVAGDGGPATQDLRGYRVLPLLLRAIGKPGDRRRSATRCATLRAWQPGRRPPPRPRRRRRLRGRRRGRTLMDAWWPLLVEAQFRPALGKRAFEQLALDARARRPHPRRARRARLLRRLVGLRRRRTCARCSASDVARLEPRLLRPRLAQPLPRGPARLAARGAGGQPRPSSTAAATATPTPQPDCFDRNRSIVASGLEHRRLPVPEPPDLPADGLDPARRPLTPRRAFPGVPRHGPLLSFLGRPKGRFVRACGSTPGAGGPPFPIRIRGR